MIEIERKFLVSSGLFKAEAISNNRIVQGFLNTDPDRTVRVRIYGMQGFLTVKGRSNEAGTTRFEWEHEIEVAEAERLLDLCEPSIVEKTRYKVPYGNHIFEVDEFEGENEGLVMAEIELSSPDETFYTPKWLGQEVTGDTRYYNSYLSKQPYQSWKE